MRDDGLTAAQGGDGVTGFAPAAGANVTVTLTGAGGATPNPAGPITGTTNAPGQVPGTVPSNKAGAGTGHATATLNGRGVTRTRQTNGQSGNSDDAVKTFVSGSLKWVKRDGSGNLLGGATFQVCATGGTAASPGHTPLCVTVLDNGPFDANPTAGLFELDK